MGITPHHCPPQEWIRDGNRLILMQEYLLRHPISPEQKQKNRMDCLKKYMPEKYEKLMRARLQ